MRFSRSILMSASNVFEKKTKNITFLCITGQFLHAENFGNFLSKLSEKKPLWQNLVLRTLNLEAPSRNANIFFGDSSIYRAHTYLSTALCTHTSVNKCAGHSMLAGNTSWMSSFHVCIYVHIHSQYT